MLWIWDVEKNTANQKKHRISFETASLVFDEPLKGRSMKKAIFNKLTPQQQTELDILADLPDDQIDTSDIPEALDWSNAKRGVFYRPVKQQITLRLDADLIAWFKIHRANGKGRGYQTSINRALREYVERHTAKG